MTTTTTATKPAGWPVRFRLFGTVPAGVNPGGFDQIKDGYVLDNDGGICTAHDSMTYRGAHTVEHKSIDEITADEAREAALVAERAAKGYLDSVAQPVGEWREPSVADTLHGVALARKARLVAWAWNVAADCKRRDEGLSERAAEYLRLTD